MIKHNPSDLFKPYRSDSHAVEVGAGSRLLLISGLNGHLADGVTLPESFENQADVVRGHIHALLHSAGMDARNLDSLRTYLADPKDDETNVRARVKHLDGCEPASTVVCCRLLEPRWKLEIEAMAAGE